jgi:hypothetical protein
VVEGGSRSGIEILNTANTLAQDPDVIYATPNWIRTGERMAEARVEYPPPSLTASTDGPRRPRTLRPKAAPTPLCSPLGVPVPNDPNLATHSWGLEAYNDIDINAFGAWAARGKSLRDPRRCRCRRRRGDPTATYVLALPRLDRISAP